MTRTEYQTSICARLDRAVRVPFKPVSIGDWSPQIADCHQNADTWARAKPDYEAVRGWVSYASFGGGSIGLTAHSVVRHENGALIDITPLCDESVRRGMAFIEHEGDPALFDAMKAGGINIDCLDFAEPGPGDEWLPGMQDESDEERE
jgi:hypothetical protein